MLFIGHLNLMLFNALDLISTKWMIYKEITKVDYYVLTLYLLILFSSSLRLLHEHFLSSAISLLTAESSYVGSVSLPFTRHLLMSKITPTCWIIELRSSEILSSLHLGLTSWDHLRNKVKPFLSFLYKAVFDHTIWSWYQQALYSLLNNIEVINDLKKYLQLELSEQQLVKTWFRSKPD